MTRGQLIRGHNCQCIYNFSIFVSVFPGVNVVGVVGRGWWRVVGCVLTAHTQGIFFFILDTSQPKTSGLVTL